MLLRPLKRIAISDTSALVEPSAGTATGFIKALQVLPQAEEGRVDSGYFAGLRVMICLEDNGAPFLSQFINSLHQEDPAVWSLSVEENVSVRQTLEDIPSDYLVRSIVHFMDLLNVGQMEDFNTIIRTELWKDKEVKN